MKYLFITLLIAFIYFLKSVAFAQGYTIYPTTYCLGSCPIKSVSPTGQTIHINTNKTPTGSPFVSATPNVSNNPTVSPCATQKASQLVAQKNQKVHFSGKKGYI